MVTAASPVGPDRADDERDQQRRDQPPGADADDEAERDQHEGEAARIDRAGECVVQLLLPKHRLAGDAHLDVGILGGDAGDRRVEVVERGSERG